MSGWGSRQCFDRWWQGHVRRRNERRLARFQPAGTPLLKRAARQVLLLQAAFLAAILVLICLPTHAQAQPADAARYQLTLRREAQQAWGLGAPVASLAAQVHQESRWNTTARSAVGAQGLAQFMPATSTWISGLYPSLADRAPENPTWALRALVVYDKWLSDRIRAADDCQRFAFALSAYNGGLGWVYKRQKLSPEPGVCFGATCTINPGVSAASQKENAHYPDVILHRWQPLYSSWGVGACP